MWVGRAVPVAQIGGTIWYIKSFTVDAATKIGDSSDSSISFVAAAKIVTYISWLKH